MIGAVNDFLQYADADKYMSDWFIDLKTVLTFAWCISEVARIGVCERLAGSPALPKQIF